MSSQVTALASPAAGAGFDARMAWSGGGGRLAPWERWSLTTVDMQFETMGRRAAELLFAAIEGRPSHGVEVIEPRVVVRGSTAVGA